MSRCLVATLLLLPALAGCAAPPAGVEPTRQIELSYRLPSATLAVGGSTALQANVLVRHPMPLLMLGLSSEAPCVQIEPSDFVLHDLVPPTALPRSEATPPALPVVPIRLFKLKAMCPAKVRLVLSAQGGDEQDTKEIDLEIVP